MEFEFMTAGTPLPPCMPLPPVLLRLPASSTAKVMYARMLDEVRFFQRGKSVVCSPFHSNLLKNSKNKTPGKPGVHACQA